VDFFITVRHSLNRTENEELHADNLGECNNSSGALAKRDKNKTQQHVPSSTGKKFKFDYCLLQNAVT
jgi:hypothetical protein